MHCICNANAWEEGDNHDMENIEERFVLGPSRLVTPLRVGASQDVSDCNVFLEVSCSWFLMV